MIKVRDEYVTNNKSLLINCKCELIKLCWCKVVRVADLKDMKPLKYFINKQYIKLEKVLFSKHIQ